VLSGLGFDAEDYHTSCSEFSGGWQMRIALSRMLLSDSELLLLDEPVSTTPKKNRSNKKKSADTVPCNYCKVLSATASSALLYIEVYVHLGA
jgi:ABC-type uncharacterized transport system YnjBCD ATPase subunit